MALVGAQEYQVGPTVGHSEGGILAAAGELLAASCYLGSVA